MNTAWYIDRIKKMSAGEVLYRIRQQVQAYADSLPIFNQGTMSYDGRVRGETLVFQPLPGASANIQWKTYRVYDHPFDLTKPVDWFFTGNGDARWPDGPSIRINCRPGNPFGDIRNNWELNRLQFLPVMAASDGPRVLDIIADWMEKNPYLHGPGYLSAMEVALRWMSIHRALCIVQKPAKASLLRRLTGLALCSGEFIEKRLSTHSSAGNHLIVEAVGLFWLGKAIENTPLKQKWINLGREILQQQVPRQINPDGSNREQSFWYLGFVLDAVSHYLLMEEKNEIGSEIMDRTEKAFEFVHRMTLPDGTFPDYGDRDDGLVFRDTSNYEESPFPGLLNVAAKLFNRPGWKYPEGGNRPDFWPDRAYIQNRHAPETDGDGPALEPANPAPFLKTCQDGGMTLMKWGKGRLLFRHAPLGLENTYGHGHADALSVLFFWKNQPVLIDPGTGQYNGIPEIRDYFRSTRAHSTVEIGGKNQADILGPFLWKKSYKTGLGETRNSPVLCAEACHDGYAGEFSTTHFRKIMWMKPEEIEIQDYFEGPGRAPMRGAFHMGDCLRARHEDNFVELEFEGFFFSLIFPPEMTVRTYFGDENPFLGWRSPTYGKWKPVHTIVFHKTLEKDDRYVVKFALTEKNHL